MRNIIHGETIFEYLRPIAGHVDASIDVIKRSRPFESIECNLRGKMNKKFNLSVLVAVFVLLFSASAKAETFFAYLNSAQEVPTNASTATGYARIFLNESAGTISFTVVFTGLSSAQTASHIHAPAAIGANVGVAINFGAVGGTAGTISGSAAITPTQISQLRSHLGYVNVHSTNFPGGEIRGQLGIKRPVDFDGDGRQDYSVLRFPAAGDPRPMNYWNLNSTTGVEVSGVWGNALTDFPTPGDYDGDGKDDLAYYRAGATAGAQSSFWIYQTATNTLQYFDWGLNGDQAICRDYDGDGKTDVAVYRAPAAAGGQAVWYIRRSSNGTVQTENWGTKGATVNDADFPIPGDYDGDGKFDVAVYRAGALLPANTYIIKRSSDGASTFQAFGNFTTDYILPGDYDGDGKFDYAVGRTGATSASPMVWWILQSGTGTLRVQPFGISSDLPVQGDYDGDARTDIAVAREGGAAVQTNFWVFNSLSNTASVTPWGVGADFPVANFDAR